MAEFTINIPDEYLPGLQAEFNALQAAGNTAHATPEEYLQASAVELLRQRCESYRVGPYFIGPVPPMFNADGSPFAPPQEAPSE